MFVRRCLLPPLCLFAARLLLTQSEASQNLTFQWDPSPEPDVVLYRLYLGTSSRAYTQNIQVGVPTTSATAPNLSDGQHYYFAVTAVNSAGVESGYSSEIDYLLPGTGTPAPAPAPNAAPTLDPLSNLTMNQNASMQTVSLTGISSGAANEAQSLQITAFSSNPALIPTPSIFYSSPNSSGALTFRPAAGQAGTATISVTVNDGQAGNNMIVRTFTVTVNSVALNIAPTLNGFGDLVIAQNSSTTFLQVSGITSGSSSEFQPLTLTATSSNPSLIPTPSVSYASPNSTGTLAFAPAANMSGSATVTLTVSDGQPLNGATSRSFVVTVNNRPTLNPLGDLSINQDSAPQTVSLGGITSGAANEVQTLQVTATSSNPALIPAPSVFYTSPNSTGALMFKPATSATGSAVITVTVSDGQAGNSTTARSFTVTVNAVTPNVAPTLNAIGNYIVTQNSAATTVPLSGITSGSSSEVQPLVITTASSNPALIPTPMISYASPNSTGSLAFAPVANVSGTATITITVSDGQALNSTISRSFVVTVNNPPTLNPLSNLTIAQEAPAQTIVLSGISAGGVGEVQPIQITATSSNPALIPNPAITYASPNTSGTMTFQPTPGATGSAAITVTVNDGQAANNLLIRSFTITVNPAAPNVAPTLNTLATIAVTQNSGTRNLVLSGISSGASTEIQPLSISAASSNPALIPNPVITYSSPNSTGTLSFTPAPNAFGAVTITATVSDGQVLNGTVSRSFTVIVNNPPTLNQPSNISIPVNSRSQAVSLSGITSGAANEVQPITVTAASSNTGLIPTPAIFYSSPNSSGVVYFTPVPNVTGSATITVTVRDGQAANNVVSRSFLVTVFAGVQSLSAFSVEGDMIAEPAPETGVIAPAGEATPFSETVVSTEPTSDTVPVSDIVQPVEQQTIVSTESATDSVLPMEQVVTEPAPSPESNTSIHDENAEPAPAPEAVAPQIFGLVVASSDARTLVLSWQTDKPATCFLEFGSTDALEWMSESTFGTTHTVVLPNLQPATLYYMRVQAADVENHFSVSEISTAETPTVNVLAWEAENAEIGEPMSVEQELETGGEAFISGVIPGMGTATFNLEFPQGMNYRVWCRVKTIGGSGLFALSFDGSGEALATVADDGSGAWHWVALTVDGAPLTFLANDGFHQVALRGVTVDTRLDKICISNDPEWQPVNFRSAPSLSISRSSSGALLEWTDPWSNAAGYVIESSANGFNFEVLDTVGSSERSYHASGAQPQKTYYRIYAFNELDRGASSAVVSLNSERDGVPNPPENVAAQVSDEGQITVMWTDSSSNETGFVLERSTDRYNFSIVQRVGADSTSAMDTPPGPGRYYYRVRAVSDEAKSEPTDSLRVLF
jgi:hypothetical protein